MDGYTLLEYIESDGTQYIDTGFKPNQDTSLTIETEGQGSTTCIFGVDSGWLSKGFGVFTNTVEYGSSSKNHTIDSSRHIFQLDKGAFFLDNELKHEFADMTFSCEYNLCVFALNRKGNTQEHTSAKLYSCQIYDNDTLIRDYVPCMDNNGVYGLYDKVNGVFYTSATDSGFTGKWAKNKTLNVSMSEYRHRMMNLIPKTGLPKGYFRCEYIESDGTNFINTGFAPNNNTRVTCDFEFMKTPTSEHACIFGSRISSSSAMYEFLWHYSNAYFRSDYNKTATNTWSTNAVGRFVVDKDKETTTFSGESKSYTNTSFSSSYNLYLFALNQAGTAQWYATARIYSCQIYDNGVKVRDYVPCVSPEGYFGLYDLVTDEFCGFVKPEPSRSYTVNTTKEGSWEKEEGINPDSSKYDGVYYSDESHGVDNGYDIMRITITGYDEFVCYIRSCAESSYDYTVIGDLDTELTYSMSGGSVGVKAHTQGNQQGTTDIESYTKVVYTGIGGGTHFIDVMYRKDSSANSADDRGYLLIDKTTVSSVITVQVIGRGRVILPSGYINAEYIEGDGNAWVDSGYFPNGNTKVVMDAQMNSYSNGLPAFFGVFGSSNRNSFSFLDPASKSDYYAYYYGSSNTASNKITAGMFDRGLIIADKGTANYHGTIVSLADASFSSTHTLYLFCGNENGTLKYNASMRLYQCQIHDNGTFTKFFVPCSKDGVFGLYDMIEGIFYSSEGSSEFTGGQDGDNEGSGGDNEGSGGDDVVTISFTINGVSYQAEEGMIWYDWCNSSYNDGRFECSGLQLEVFVKGSETRLYDGSLQYGQDIIREGRVYEYFIL